MINSISPYRAFPGIPHKIKKYKNKNKTKHYILYGVVFIYLRQIIGYNTTRIIKESRTHRHYIIIC